MNTEGKDNLLNFMNDAVSNSVEICRFYMDMNICEYGNFSPTMIGKFRTILIHCFKFLYCFCCQNKYINKQPIGKNSNYIYHIMCKTSSTREVSFVFQI